MATAPACSRRWTKAWPMSPSERLGAVIMVTDGVVHDIPSSSPPHPKAPLHVLVTGHEGERDRR